MVAPGDFTSVGGGWTGELPEICTLQEVAQYLRETVSFIRTQIRRGEFPNAWRAHKGYRIPRSDVMAYTEKMYGHRQGGRTREGDHDAG